MTATLVKLAFAGIRSRLLASALTVLLSAVAAATIVLALEVGATARDPWQRTFDAANGAHVTADVAFEADARKIATPHGVAQSGAAFPSTTTRMTTAAGATEPLRLAGLSAATRVDVPVRTAGSRLREGGIVLERSLAKALGLQVGTRLRFAAPGGAIELPVVGTAISPSQPRYPRSNPGLAWVTRAAFERIAPDRSRWTWTQGIRLTDPATAPAFATRAAAAMGASGPFLVRTWEQQREEVLRDTQPLAVILIAYTIVLLVVVFAVVAILVGARASEQHREIGLLKAVGLTPRQVTITFALESAALGLIAVVIGFAAGAVLAPQLAAPTAETMLASPTIAASPWDLLFASCPVVLVLVASARASTRRSTRFSVLQGIQSGATPPASSSRLARTIGRLALPLPLALGLKDLLARRHRALRLAGAIAVTGAGIVFALSMKATLDAVTRAAVDDVPDELPVLVYTLDAVLLVITATTLVAVALLSVRERIRDYSVLKTLGLTPRQIAWSLVGAHATLGLIAALLSIPLGIGLYLAVYAAVGADADDLVLAPWWWLALVPIGALPVIAGITSLPARLATRIPSAQALRYE
jgi:ABC-type antimicrobial peptide transport system permease subunit